MLNSSKDHEKIAKENERFDSQKYALKIDKMENSALERHIKPIIDPLKQIVENIVEFSKDLIIILFARGREFKIQKKTECFV